MMLVMFMLMLVMAMMLCVGRHYVDNANVYDDGGDDDTHMMILKVLRTINGDRNC